MNAWNVLAEKMVDWLVTTSWQAAVLALLVMAAQILFRRLLNARWSYLLWLLVVGRLLLPSLPESPASLYRYVPASPVSQIHFATPIFHAAALSPVEAAPALASAPAGNVPSSSDAPPMSAQGILLIVWLAGFLALAISLVERNRRFRRTVLAGCRPASGQVREQAGLLAREMGVAHPFEVVEASVLETPAVVGLLRTKLLLPHDFTSRLSEDELALVFRHELAHLKRGDLWMNFLVCVLQIVHWFNPVLWWAFSRMRHDRELATDALALHLRSNSRLAYGETLVKLAAGNLPRTSLNPAIGILENHRRIRQRIERIARLGPKAYAWSAVGIVLLIALGLVTLTKAPAQVQQPSTDSGKTNAQREVYQADLDRPIREGNINQVRDDLDHGADPNGSVGMVLHFGPSGPVGYGPVLFYAVANQQEGIVKLLLARGAHLEAKSGWGETPVHHALVEGNKAIADDLIAAGAKYDVIQYLTATGDVAALAKKDAAQPFTADQLNNIIGDATTAGQPAVIAWTWPKLKLSSAQATEKRNGLLKSAAEWNQLNVAQYLIQQGVDFSKCGRDTFENAISRNSPEVARFIAEKYPAAFDAQRDRVDFSQAVELGWLEMVRLYVDLGYNINGRDEIGPPLCQAAYHQQEEVCRFLIDHGADITIRDNQGENAAWWAAFAAGSPKTLKALLDRHIDIGGRNSSGWPIMVDMLTFSDPRPGVRAFPGKIYTTAEIEEAHRKQREVIGMLAHAGADLNATSSIGSPLTVAIQGSKDTIVRALIENGADVRALDGRGYTPLVAAMKAGDTGLSLPTIQLLLDKGADPNTTSVYIYDKPPLPPQSVLKSLLLREAGLDRPDFAFPEVMKLLLSRGAHFTAPISDKDNRWLTAAVTGDLDALKTLKAQGVAVDASDGDRWTALDVALAAGHAACADWLLQVGAKASSSTTDGHDALYFAVNLHKLDLINRLLAAGADAKSSQAVGLAAEVGDLPIVRRLLDAGADGKNISIYVCIREGYVDIARLALEHGANPDPHDNGEKRYNVYWALSYRQPEILKMILDRGADPTVETLYPDETPLKYAQKWWPAMVPVIQDALAKWKQHGASTTKIDQGGRPTISVTVR